MEISQVRRRVQAAMASARAGVQERRRKAGEAEQAYEQCLTTIIVPLARQVASVLNAEGFDVTVSQPGRSVRVTSERARHDVIEVALSAAMDPPQVTCRTTRMRGSRTIQEEEPIRQGAAPGDLTEDDVLSCLLHALGPWLER